MLAYLAWLLIAGSAAGCVYLLYAGHAVGKFARRPVPQTRAHLPVSVLKPLRGEDPSLADNLRSFVRQDYPAFQVVFGVADPDDPAVGIVRQLIAEFPAADLVLVVDRTQSGANLKIANLRNMLPAARHELLVIADSDMRVGSGYVAAVTAPLARADGAGLVTCLYRGLSAGGFWSDVACLHINHGFLPQAIVAETLGGAGGCFGATMALRRQTLAAAGGLEALADTLADDNALGQAVRRLGRGVELSPYLIDDLVSEPGLGALFRHELRWARTVRLVAPVGFLGSIVTYPLPLALLALGLQPSLPAAQAMLLLALLVRGLSGRRIDRALRLAPAPFWVLPLRDVLSFAVFAASFCGRSVSWRDRRFRIGPGGRLVTDAEKSR